MDARPPGTFYLHENSNLLTKERSEKNIYAFWKEAHKKRPDCYHQVSYEPDIPVNGMPRRWDCSQLKPGDDLMGEPCCDAPILVWNMRGFWSCTECGQLWTERRTIHSGNIAETCDIKRGSLSCEECDSWVIVGILPPSVEHPHGYAVEGCTLDGAVKMVIP